MEVRMTQNVTFIRLYIITFTRRYRYITYNVKYQGKAYLDRINVSDLQNENT